MPRRPRTVTAFVNAEDAFAFYAAWQCPVAFRGDVAWRGKESGSTARVARR